MFVCLAIDFVQLIVITFIKDTRGKISLLKGKRRIYFIEDWYTTKRDNLLLI